MITSKHASVITAVSRHEPAYLQAAGESVAALAEQLPAWSIDWNIALDGVATEWVKEAVGDITIPTVLVPQGGAEPKRGAAFPRNRALAALTSEWVINLDADDTLVPEYG